MGEVRRLRWRDRSAALAYLARDPAANLMLLDAASRLGGLRPGRLPAGALAAAYEGDAIRGVLSIRPSVLLDAAATPEAITALAPQLEHVAAGLIRSPVGGVERLWSHLLQRGRRALVDRREVAHRLPVDTPSATTVPDTARLRLAAERDLEDLVVAARASLREEGRPDPFHGDPHGFRSWVQGRMPRAHVIEDDGRLVFVAYADVQRPDGWLLQGVYTWPDRRRRGFARQGIAGLCRRAAAAGADHVQLAVVQGNAPAERLYASLGFEPFAELRTILFQ